MDSYGEVFSWALDRGFKISGVKPHAIPDRGIGFIATRHIEVGETILEIPIKFSRSLKDVPKAISKKLPRSISLHALLAAYLTLDKTDAFAVPDGTLPPLSLFEASMPFFWPPELHSYLPKAAKDLLEKQQNKIQRDWNMVLKAFPHISHERYLHSWMLVNTRSFYYTIPSMERLPHDDRLAFFPVADLFNHADVGCDSAFTSESYTFTADREYGVDEELYICYGTHSNDFLLAEYGFMPAENRWDTICLDDAILPLLNEEQKDALKHKGFLGKYMLDEKVGVCFRTQVAVRMLCCTRVQWEQFVESEADADSLRLKAEILLMQIMETFVKTIHQTLKDLDNLDTEKACQREVLARRWKQIESGVVQTMRNLSN